mmetsp:Transcript_26821/g.53483  ORF Transcript_26821/g.53483 Transcript_26821/m.53483 type:complete len:214 (+) Transcript_26821:331-972(+)
MTPSGLLSPLSQLALKALEYDVRVSLRHAPHLLNVMPQDSAAQREESTRPQWKVTHNKAVRLAPGLLEHHEVGEVCLVGGRDELVDPVPSPVDPLGVWDDQVDLLAELLEPRRRLPARRHTHPRIVQANRSVLVVDSLRTTLCQHILGINLSLQFVVIVAQLGGDRRAILLGCLDQPFRVLLLASLALQRLAVQVLSAQPCSPPNARRGGHCA